MSKRPDINLYSFNGPADNGRTVEHLPRKIAPDLDIADTIKCSTGLSDCRIKLGEVCTGYEDALDVNNRCRFLDIEAERWVFPEGRAAIGFTIKGGSRNVRVSGWVQGDPLVDIGNASDQSNEPTTGVRLNLRRVDGKPIRVRVLNGAMPTLEPGSGPYRYVFPWRIRLLQAVAIRTFLLLRKVLPL